MKAPTALAEALGSLRAAFTAVGAFSFVINLLLVAPALYMLQIYDRVLASRNETTLYMLTIILIGVLALEALLELARSRIMVRASSALDARLSSRVFDASFERTLRSGGANAGQALGDLSQVRQFVTGKGLFAFFDAPWTPIFIIVIFLLSPWLGLFALCSALLLFALAWVNERTTGPALEAATQHAHAANSYAGRNLRNAEIIEALGMLPGLRRRWLERQERFLLQLALASDRAGAIGAGSKFARTGLQSGILGAGALLVLDNQLTPGGMIAASILLGRALSPVDLAIATWRGMVSARGAYGRLNALLNAHPARGEMTALPAPAGAVALENVVLGAPGSRTPILKGVSFQVPAGSAVAIVGPSAAGKSTLARALVGVWQPMNGVVRLDGADVNHWNRAELGPWLGYLPQDVELFEGTIAENIARFDEPDAAKIVGAAQKAGVHEMVLRLAQGYDTPIGEGGMALSAGQRQRVALARALYGEPALIVLDEPNASLDDAGDAALIAALRQLKAEKRTVFVVTHRANILAAMDLVMQVADGRVKTQAAGEGALKSLTKVA